MDGKIILLMMSVVAIGMFVLPSTLALYTGQHEFINGTNVECTKCHGGANVFSGGSNITLELLNGTPHNSFSDNCTACHGNSQYTGAYTYHSAVGGQVTCLGCHGSATPPDTKDGHVNVSANISSSNEAHVNMTALTLDPDDGCIACHTTVTVNGSIAVPAEAANVTLIGTGNSSHWLSNL